MLIELYPIRIKPTDLLGTYEALKCLLGKEYVDWTNELPIIDLFIEQKVFGPIFYLN